MVNAIARDANSEGFFDAAAEGRLVTRKCRDCGGWSEPSALRCTHCHSDAMEWADTQGRGVVASWVVIPPGRNAPEDTPPSVVAFIELEEGPWITMALPEAEGAAMGLPVTIDFVRPEGGEYIPIAVPAN